MLRKATVLQKYIWSNILSVKLQAMPTKLLQGGAIFKGLRDT